MKKMAKVAALLAAMVLAAGLTACQGKGSSKGLLMDGTKITGFRPDVPAKLSIPKGTVIIDEYAFEECLALESVTIPDTVEQIWEGAFWKCKNLKSVRIPASMTHIYAGAFHECPNLKEVKYAGTKAQWETIKKSSPGIGNFVVHCKDGDVTETLIIEE